MSELKPGQTLPRDLAERLLRETLSTHKSIVEEAALADWASDCVLALTARIRPDAVIVNRAAAFAEWQESVGDSGAEMPEQARSILFAMCGDGFVSLTLPEEDAVTKDDEQADADSSGADDAEGEDAGKAKGEADDAEPSKASRGVFGDLFGGDPAEKISRAQDKEDFATRIRKMLTEAGNKPPTRNAIIAFREEQGLPDLDTSRPDKYPQEVSSSGRPNNVAKRYRKLLVGLNLWPKSDEESGLPRTPAVSSFGKHVTANDEQSRNAHINALDLIDACPKPEEGDEASAAPTSGRVFTPPWAPVLAERVAAATDMPVNANPLNEYKRLMFALAARRISQTQTWTKRNEAERHKAAVKEDAAKKKLEELDPDGSARAWFSAHEEKRGEDSQAASEFRITRRMVGECDAVFKAWQGTNSAEEREKETALVQENAEKFGDARFFADLSEDPDAGSIWRHNQGAEIVRQWVRLRQAQHDQQRLKIPRFCHPDPFHHPTWCEFGGSSKPKVWYAWRPDSKPQRPESGGDADGSRRLWMLLPDFEAGQARAVPMRWRCKRLSHDLGGVRESIEVSVPRADRISLAAAGLRILDTQNEPIRYRPEHPFAKNAKGWNARLQLDRDSLERLERKWDESRRDWRDDGKALRFARWFVTFAPELVAMQGPGRDIHPKLGWKGSPHSDLNKKQKREGHAKLGLARLPGLRVLSVDLGHRFAASCAVWEAISGEQFKRECAGRTITAGGADGVFCHTQHSDERRKSRTTIYRRIGADTLPDGSPHPAPWARLERQFLIKLQGEERPARKASTAELDAVRLFETTIERQRTQPRDQLPWRVDELMAEAVRSARLGLYRHGDAARIAYAFMPGSVRHKPGGATEEHTDETRKAAILDALVRWHGLCGDARSRWRDERAKTAWDELVAPKLKAALPELAEGATGPERKAHRKTIEEALSLLAAELAARGNAGAPELFKLWRTRWEADHAQWPQHLKRLNRWLLPRTLRAAMNETTQETQQRKARLGAARHVGGLSLTRIATIRQLWQVQKAYHYGAAPDNLRAGVRRIEEDSAAGRTFGDAALRTMERMREQRVKQIASRIAASALGLGGHWKTVLRRDSAGRPVLDKRGQQRTKRVWVEEPNAKYPPCHAIVIENLRPYRPDELQTRRENKALMAWSSAKVAKYLGEACQLNGLHLREVSPNYTSRQCSRTGLPGLRCVDVTVKQDTGEPDAYWWKQMLATAEKKTGKDGEAGDAESRFIVALSRHLNGLKDSGGTLPRTVRLPRRGGDLFVAAPTWAELNRDGVRAGAAVQADLNAAANIGLRALLDPDFAGRWWYVPCETATGKPAKDKCAGSACLDLDAVLIDLKVGADAGKKQKAKGKSKEITNAWHDVGDDGPWKQHTPYWNGVTARVMARLSKANGLVENSIPVHDDDIETPF